MAKKELTVEQRKLDVDLWAIALIPFAVLGIYIAFMLFTKQITSYLPFQSVWTTQEVLSSGFPVNVVGMLIPPLLGASLRASIM